MTTVQKIDLMAISSGVPFSGHGAIFKSIFLDGIQPGPGEVVACEIETMQGFVPLYAGTWIPWGQTLNIETVNNIRGTNLVLYAVR